MNRSEIVRHLVSIGKALDSVLDDRKQSSLPRPDTPKSNEALDLSILDGFDHINRIGPNHWALLLSDYSDDNVIFLLKGLTHVERQLKWLGGSACGCIWIFKILCKRSASVKILDDISAWILNNTDNPYNPLGGRVASGARNYSEHIEFSERNRKLNTEHELQVIEDADVNRSNRKLRREYSAERRESVEREQLIERLNSMAVIDQLILISKDTLNSPTYYPTRCADLADMSVISLLAKETRQALRGMLYGRQRGPWLAFKKRLNR
jgi:hypothetical protein